MNEGRKEDNTGRKEGRKTENKERKDGRNERRKAMKVKEVDGERKQGRKVANQVVAKTPDGS